jgi:hypothetical protein
MNRYLNGSDRFGMTVEGRPEFGCLPADQLMISKKDRTVLRELAKKKHAYAIQPVMEERRKRWRAANDLRMQKPPLRVDEICWAEMNRNHELDLQCSHPFAAELEDVLRKELYCEEHGLGDVIIEDYIESPLVVYDSGFGIDEKADIVSTERNREVVSRHFRPFILGMDDIEKIREPEIFLDMERTLQYTELLEDIFDGILPVQITGARGLWFTPWDYLIRVMGVNETMLNLIDEPEFVEAVVKRYVHCAMVRMDRYRELGIWASNNTSCRVGSGGYGLVSCLDRPEKASTHCDTRQMWGCGNAQIFSGVSEEMHWQFSLQYEMEWLQCFGLTYYGCCEPLFRKMDMLEKIPNLRKVSMSPWNDLKIAAERCRGKYVMSCKPSPAVFAENRFDETEARRAIENIIHDTAGCSIEIVMKDISTVGYRPEILWRWAAITRETIDALYN